MKRLVFWKNVVPLRCLMDFVDEICIFKCGSDSANIVKIVFFVLRDFSLMLVNFVRKLAIWAEGGDGVLGGELANDFVGVLGGGLSSVFLFSFSAIPLF